MKCSVLKPNLPYSLFLYTKTLPSRGHVSACLWPSDCGANASIRPLQQRFSRAFLPCSYPLPPATSQGSNRPLPQRPLLQAGFLLLCDLTFAATATSSPAPAPCSCSPASAVLPHAVEALSGSPCYGRLILCFLDLMAIAPLFRDMRSKCF